MNVKSMQDVEPRDAFDSCQEPHVFETCGGSSLEVGYVGPEGEPLIQQDAKVSVGGDPHQRLAIC